MSFVGGSTLMRAYALRRLLALIPTLIFATIIVFVTVRMVPGNVVDLMLSQNDISAGAKDREQLEIALGLDKPMYIQYFYWIGGVLKGDLGHSLVAEHAGARPDPGSFASHVRAWFLRHHHWSHDRDSDRRLFGAAAGHDRRLHHALDLDPHAGGSGVLGRHHGHGVSLDLVGLGPRVALHTVHRSIRLATSST